MPGLGEIRMARVALGKNELKYKIRFLFRFLGVITLFSKKEKKKPTQDKLIGNTHTSIFNKLVLGWKNNITPTLEL